MEGMTDDLPPYEGHTSHLTDVQLSFLQYLLNVNSKCAMTLAPLLQRCQ